MRRIEFLSLHIEGFKSIESLDFNFTSNGLNLLRGKNGCGKTTIFDALYWVLFNQCLKNTNSDKIQTKEAYRTKDFVGTRVLVNLIADNHEYQIARHFKYKDKTNGKAGESKLMIFEDGELRVDELHKSHQQEFINNILGADAKMFISSVLYGQRMKKFIEGSAEDKREILSDFFEVEWVDEAKNNASLYLEKAKEKENKFNQEIEKLQLSISFLEQQKKEEAERELSFETNKASEIKELRAKVVELTNKIKNLSTVPDFKENLALSASINILNVEIEKQKGIYELAAYKNTESKRKEKENKEKISKLETFEIETNCHTCNRPLTEEAILKVKQDISDKIEKLKALKFTIEEYDYRIIEDLEDQKSKLEADYIIYQQEHKDYKAIIKLNNEITLANTEAERDIVNVNNQIQKLTESKFKKSTVDFDSELKTLSNNINTLTKKLEALDGLKTNLLYLTKTVFGANGLKSFIINSMLEFLNITIKKYAIRLGLDIKFSVDLQGTRKTFLTKCYKGDIEIDYEELSGGEKTRIDLSLSLGLFDLMAKIKVEYNILIFDEAFENLDEEGVYDMYDLLKEAAKNCGVYLITHNENMDLMNTNIIDIQKIKNLTHVITC